MQVAFVFQWILVTGLFFLTGHGDHGLDQPCESHNSTEKEPQRRVSLHELRPSALKALHELVSLVHHHVDVIDQSQPSLSTSTTKSELNANDDVRKNVAAELFHLEDDPVAKIIWALKPHDFQDVCLAMAVSLHFVLKHTGLSWWLDCMLTFA